MIKVALCWDDGVNNDVRVMELLKKHHAKATFNLCPGYISEDTIPQSWQHDKSHYQGYMGYTAGHIGKKDLVRVYRDFPVAAHCWRHEDVAVTELGAFVKSAVETRKFLEDTFGRSCPGFVWPYGHGTDDAAQALQEAGFTYGRLVGSTTNVFDCKSPLLLTPSCHFMDSYFWKIFDETKKTGSGVFYFWGHSYEMMGYDELWKQFEYKLEFLDADPEVEWIDVAEIPALFPKKEI